MKIRILSAQDVNKAIDMKRAIEILHDAFRELSDGNAVMPPRRIMDFSNNINSQRKGLVAFMPAYLPVMEEAGIKISTLLPSNPLKNLPFIQGVVVLINIETGEIKSLINAAALTALRTGAASGVATNLLARKDANSLAIIGSGAQAITQLEAVCCVRDISNIKIYSSTPANAQRFAEHAKAKYGDKSVIETADSIHNATKDADIICTATSSQTPILFRENVKLGAHINVVGGHTLETRETSASLMSNSKIFVEHYDATKNESCEKNVLELGEIINNKSTGRDNAEQITLYGSVGVAIQDISVAAEIYSFSEKNNLGTIIDM